MESEKKVEVEVNGRIVRVSKHMLDDISRFGATLVKRAVKEPPKELLSIPEPKKVVLPPVEPPKLDLPEAKDIEYPGEVKTRKPRTKK